MIMETAIFSDFHPNFLNLSLLICHLFAGGNFRMAHILYDLEAYDDHMFNAIDAACPLQIPMMTTDISAFGITEYNDNSQSDDFLQLIFLPPEHLAKNIDRIGKVLTFYRVFIFSSNGNPDSERTLMNNVKLIGCRNSSSLLLIHNESSGETKSYILSENPEVPVKAVDLQKNKSNSNVFEAGLGDEALRPTFGVSIMNETDCKSVKAGKLQTPIMRSRAFGRIFYTKFNMSYMDATTLHCNGSIIYPSRRTVRPNQQLIYNDFSSDVESVEDPKKTKEFSTRLHFDPGAYKSREYTNQFIPISPHKLAELYVFFAYGLDHVRGLNSFDMVGFWSGWNVWMLGTVFIVIAIALYRLSRTIGFRRVDFGVGLLEVFVVVFGGGNIQYRHHWEKMSFAIGLIASFFFMSIYLANFSMHSVLLHEPSKITTFDELAKQNVKFYISSVLAEHRESISGMLGFKLKKNITLDIGLSQISLVTTNSFAGVIHGDNLIPYRAQLIKRGVDLDVIQESLGKIKTNFYLASDLHVPQQRIRKFNQMTMSLVENGWFQFIDSLEIFWMQISGTPNIHEEKHQFDFEPITLGEFYYPLLIYLCHLAGISVIFVLEFVWFRFQARFRSLISQCMRQQQD